MSGRNTLIPKDLYGEHKQEVLAAILGVVISLVIVAFIWATERVAAALYTAQSASWMRFVAPTAGALVSGYLLYHLFPEARGSGIPQTKAALITGRPISFRTVFGKFACCSISLGSGISLGREGPSVQLGAGIASVVGRQLKLSRDEVHNLIPAGTAAALAAAFNTPLAAVLFTLEEVLGDMHAKMIGSVVLSAASSWIVLNLLLGDQPLFHVPAYRLAHPAELLVYVVLGLSGGVLSALFQKGILRLREAFQQNQRIPRAIQPMAGGLLVGAMAIFVPEVLGVGYAAVDRALNGGLLWPTMVMLLILKFPATIVSYSSGNPGGIFGPSLFFGAMLGGSIGSLVHSQLPQFTGSPGAYALVGMGTTFAGIIRTPMTSVIMIFELTRDYNIIVPLMISNLISYWMARRLTREPIYEALAAQDGIHLKKSATHEDEKELFVRDAMRPLQHSIDPDALVGDLARFGTRDILVARDGFLWGIIRSSDLAELSGDRSATQRVREILSVPPHVDPAPPADVLPHLHPDHRLDIVMQKMGRYGLEVLPVTDRMNPRRILGEIRAEYVLAAYRKPQTELVVS